MSHLTRTEKRQLARSLVYLYEDTLKNADHLRETVHAFNANIKELEDNPKLFNIKTETILGILRGIVHGNQDPERVDIKLDDVQAMLMFFANPQTKVVERNDILNPTVMISRLYGIKRDKHARSIAEKLGDPVFEDYFRGLLSFYIEYARREAKEVVWMQTNIRPDDTQKHADDKFKDFMNILNE